MNATGLSVPPLFSAQQILPILWHRPHHENPSCGAVLAESPSPNDSILSRQHTSHINIISETSAPPSMPHHKAYFSLPRVPFCRGRRFNFTVVDVEEISVILGLCTIKPPALDRDLYLDEMSASLPVVSGGFSAWSAVAMNQRVGISCSRFTSSPSTFST